MKCFPPCVCFTPALSELTELSLPELLLSELSDSLSVSELTLLSLSEGAVSAGLCSGGSVPAG